MHAAALREIASAELVAVFCHGESSAEAARADLPGVPVFRDYDRMLREVDADVVSVAVPNLLHSEFAVAALDRGRHVFLEKPLGITLDQCDRVIEAQRRTGRQVALNHELRVSKQWGPIRETITKGDLGRVRYQNFSLFRHAFRQGSGGWRYDPTKVGSWVLEELVHFFDLVLWYGRENGLPEMVDAIGSRARSAGEHWDNFTTRLTWSDGSYATLTQCLAGFEHHSLLEIAGTDGSLRSWWSGAMDRTLTPSFDLKIQAKGSERAEAVTVPLSGEVFELRENLRQALDGFRRGETILGPVEARQAVAVCLAAERSAREGRPVRPDFGAAASAA
jgi:myo-inositol 2-dehydrogenase/D-chiro-inositol 1-dehydrogenase